VILTPLGASGGYFVTGPTPFTLLLAGELTDAPIFATLKQLREAFPHAEEHVFEGQRHIAFAADREGFANTVLRLTRRH
jgi:hypothetical protein